MSDIQNCSLYNTLCSILTFLYHFPVSVMYFKQCCGKSYCQGLTLFRMESGECGGTHNWYWEHVLSASGFGPDHEIWDIQRFNVFHWKGKRKEFLDDVFLTIFLELLLSKTKQFSCLLYINWNDSLQFKKNLCNVCFQRRDCEQSFLLLNSGSEA